MRVLVDPETGEVVEALPADVIGVEPYDYAQAKRAVMAATRERREAERQLRVAIDEKARAEGEYRRRKAEAIVRLKREHGATVAADLAKGDPVVVEALERRERAVETVAAWRERLRLCSEDRASLHRLIEWSQTYDRFHGGETP